MMPWNGSRSNMREWSLTGPRQWLLKHKADLYNRLRFCVPQFTVCRQWLFLRFWQALLMHLYEQDILCSFFNVIKIYMITLLFPHWFSLWARLYHSFTFSSLAQTYNIHPYKKKYLNFRLYQGSNVIDAERRCRLVLAGIFIWAWPGDILGSSHQSSNFGISI